MVDHNHDRVETPGGREISDMVNREEGEGNSGSGWDGDEGWGHRVHVRFHLLTEGATLDIFMDIGTKTWPPEVMLDEFFHLKLARVAHHGVIVEPAEKIMLSRREDVGVIFIVQDRVNNFPIGQCRFHGWKTETVQCIRGGGENRI
jgi:hypothetical protein